jgi:hypothetical protein
MNYVFNECEQCGKMLDPYRANVHWLRDGPNEQGSFDTLRVLCGGSPASCLSQTGKGDALDNFDHLPCFTGERGVEQIEQCVAGFQPTDRKKVRDFLRAFAAWGKANGVHGMRRFA